MAELSTLRNDVADQVNRTRQAGQETGANVVASTFSETNADELREHLEGVKKQGAANIEAARAASTEQAGTTQSQQGNTQTQAGQTLMAGASVAAASGLGTAASLGMFAAGTALVATGQGNQVQGGQKIEAAPPMITNSADLSNQSENHFNKAGQIKRERESGQANNDAGPSNSAKETGKNQGYYAPDSDDARTSTDNELVADRLTDGEKAVNEQLGITTDSDTEKDGITTDDKTTIASQLRDRAQQVDGSLGL